jgi:hypothetical protein
MTRLRYDTKCQSWAKGCVAEGFPPCVRCQLAAAEAEVKRLRREGVPGVMHEIDQAFYDLAIQERNLERSQNEQLTRERDDLLAELDRLRGRVNRAKGADA